MKKVYALIVGLLVLAMLSFGQATPSAPASNSIGHGAFPVKVVKTLDSSKLKEGDTVELETSGGFKLPDGTLVPKGSKMVGHVTSAKARSKGDPDSQLTIVFDKLNAGGKQMTVKGAIQAVFPPADEPTPEVPGAATSHGGAGAGMTAGSVPPPDYHPMSDVKSDANSGGGHAEPSADPKSVGVHGMDNLELNNGVLTSKGKNVKLGGGVRMIVRCDIFG